MHKTAVCITLLTLLCLLLLDCRQEEEGVATVTAVSQQPTATMTIIPTVAPSATIVATKTAVVFDTPTSTPTQTGLDITPTSTFIPSRTPTPTVPPRISGEVPYQTNTTFELRPPDPQLLANLFHDQFRSSFRFIKSDIDHYYPSGLPEIMPIIQDPTFSYHNVDYDGLYWEIIKQGIIGYLNAEQIELENVPELNLPRYDIYATQIEINGYEPKEFILQVSYEQYRKIVFIPLFTNQDGQYELVPNEIPLFSLENAPYGFIRDYDLTGDGLNEMIQVHSGGLGSYTYWETNIFTWDGTQIALLEQLDEGLFYSSPVYEVHDVNGDGIDDIVSPYRLYPDVGYKRGFDCSWSATKIYSWPNGEAQHYFIDPSDPDAPNSPECDLARTVGHPIITGTERIELLTHTLSHSDMQTPSIWYTNFKALVLIHLGMEYVAEDNFEAATAVLDQLLDLPDDSDFVQVVQEIYKQDGERPLRFCYQLVDRIEPSEFSEFGQYLTYGDIFGSVDRDPTSGNLYRPALCDYYRIVRNRLQDSPLSADKMPSEILAELDIELRFVQSTNLDNDAELEWFGVSEKHMPSLVIFDRMGDWWNLEWGSAVQPVAPVDLEIVTTDVTGDDLEDVIAVVTNLVECGNELAPRTRVVLLYSAEVSGEFKPTYGYCDEGISYELPAINEEYFYRTKAYPIWRNLSDFNELQTAVLTQTNPNIATKITDLLSYMPTDDPEAQPYREHLTYLLGYHYELSGDEAKAVTTYLNLIQQAPSSPWSWLAWARLEPVE